MTLLKGCPHLRAPFFLLRYPVKFAILTKNVNWRRSTMRILGIDPGYATIGFGMVESLSLIHI